MEEIKGEDYTIQYNLETGSIDFKGDLALKGPLEYKPIKELLEQIVASQPSIMTLNLKELLFLNSSGIAMLSKFILSFRKKKEIQLVVLGCKETPWQSKSLKNFQKLLPSLELNIN